MITLREADMDSFHFVAEGINPEPWTAGMVSTGTKAGKRFTRVTKLPQLRVYQLALQEQLIEQLNGEEAHFEPWLGSIGLEFVFSRCLEQYKSPSGRNVTRHRADVTNLQKATEDALQGFLFKNDVQVARIESVMFSQKKDITPRIEISMHKIDTVRIRTMRPCGFLKPALKAGIGSTWTATY